MAQQPQKADDSFKMNQFGGMLPAWDDHLLPDGQAASSTNGYLFSGALEPWRIPKALNTFLDNPGYVYRLPKETSAVAQATLWFLDNADEGAKVLLGEETYTFTATVNAAYKVLIGANAAATATNFFNAITADNGANTNAGTQYGTGTVANPAVDQTRPLSKNTLATDFPRVTVVAPDTGSVYNGTLVSGDGVDLVWKTAAGVVTTTFTGGANININTTITSPSTWLEFVDPYTDVVRSPVVDDQFDRYYMASSSLAPMYNTRARIEAGLPAWLLGVPAPGCAPGVSVTGGGDTATIGFPNTVAADTGAPGANTIYMIKVTPGGAQILNDVSIVTQTTNASARFAAVLYNDNAGTPHTLLNTGVIITGCAAGGTVSSAFTNPTGLLMNTPYWIGIMCDSVIAFQRADDTGSAGVVSLNTFTNGPPGTIQNLSTGYPDLQMWGDLTTTSLIEARSYVYTYITEYGEESPPSPATVATGWSNGTWTITFNTPPPDQMGGTRDIKYLRLYRSVTATTGATTYYQVTGVNATASSGLTDLPVTTTTYTDVVTDDVVVTNNQLQSQLWSPPPENLQGLVVMPNGMIAGWKSNEIWFCEPYRPHAWPPSYVLTTEYPIVGLGVSGNSVVAATEGAPYVANGTSPASMTAMKIQNSEPCHSRKSILGGGDGVYYASRNGLIKVDQYAQMTNLTESWITREKWQQLTPQANLAAVFLVGQYYAWEWGSNGNEGGLGNRGFTIELGSEDADSFTIWPQPGRHRLGFQLLANALATPINMVEIDPWSAVCLLISRNVVYQIDFTDASPVLSVVDWTSKKYQQRTKKSFEAQRILFSVPPNSPALNPTRLVNPPTDPIWTQPLPPDRWGYILTYAAGQLVTAREIRTIQEVLRIESGFKHETWQWRIITRMRIATVQIGSTLKGMANV